MAISLGTLISLSTPSSSSSSLNPISHSSSLDDLCFLIFVIGWNLIQEPHGQDILLDILHYTHVMFGRPTVSLQMLMREKWKRPKIGGREKP